MGNCNFKTDKPEEDKDGNAMSKNLYDMQYIIGRGGFGKVSCWLIYRSGRWNINGQRRHLL
jgi:hypothetical protein